MTTPTPYALVSRVESVQEGSKRLLVDLSRQLEQAALVAPPRAVAASLQDARHLTERTRACYAALAATGAAIRMHARGLQTWLAPGVVGVALEDSDPLVDEWVVVVDGPQPVVLAATDLHRPAGSDLERSFTYAVSRDRWLVRDCATLLGVG